MVKLFLLCISLALAFSQNIILPDDYELTLSDLDCIYTENPDYHILVPLNNLQEYKFTPNPYFLQNYNLLYNYTCNSTCKYNGCHIINPIVTIDLSYSTEILEVIRQINSVVSQIQTSACATNGAPLITFLVDSESQKWSRNTSVNSLFWQVIIPNLNYKSFLWTNQSSFVDVFGNQNVTNKFGGLFCIASSLDGNDTCVASTDNCSFGGFSGLNYYKVYNQNVGICGINFLYESNLQICKLLEDDVVDYFL